MFILQMSGQVLSWVNIRFLLQGLSLTLFISFVAIILSMFFGIILALMRYSQQPVAKVLSSIYIEVVRNVPNLLWIFMVFLVFQLKSVPAGIVSFTIFTSVALAEIIRGGLNGVKKGQIEAGKSQGFTEKQITYYIVLPQALRKMLPAIISQMTTVVKDTSLLYSVIALQEMFGSSQILMGQYFQASQVFMLYGFVTAMYFAVNFILSLFARKLKKSWVSSLE